MGDPKRRLRSSCIPKSPQLQDTEAAGSATSYAPRPLRQSMRLLTMTPKQLYEASSITSQPSDPVDKHCPLEEMMGRDSSADHSEEPVVSKYFTTSPEDNTDHPAYELPLGFSFPPHVYSAASSDVAASASATHGGSVSPITITYKHPSIESVDGSSSSNTSGVGDRNTPLSTGSTVLIPPISSSKASKTLGEIVEGKQSKAASDAEINRLCTDPDVSVGTVTIDPQAAKTTTFENRLDIGNIAVNVREVKELLAKMVNDQSEKTSDPRTDEVPSLLNQVVEELKQLNGKSNSATEVLHKKIPSPPESATAFLVKGPVSDGDQKGSPDYTWASLKQPASRPGNGYGSIRSVRCFPRPGVGRLTTACHPSEQHPSENATCCMDKHVTKSSLIISDVEDSDVEVPKTKMANILAKKEAEIAKYRAIIVGKDDELTSKDHELAKKDLEIATKDIEITNLNQAIRRKDSMIESYMRLFTQKNEQIANLQLREKQLTDNLREMKLGPSPGTLKGLGFSDAEILDLVDGDEGLWNLISGRMKILLETERIAGASKSQHDTTAGTTSGQPESDPEVVGDGALRQVKPVFAAGLVNNNSDPEVGGAADSSVGQFTSRFGDLESQHTDFTFGHIAARPSADKGQPLSGCTSVNHNPDSKAGAGGLGAKPKTMFFPPYSSMIPGAKSKSSGAPPSHFNDFPPSFFDVPAIFKDPPSFFNGPPTYPFLSGAHHEISSSVTKGAGSANTNPLGGAFDAFGASCAPSASGNNGQGPSKPVRQPTFSEDLGTPFARNPFFGYIGPTETSAVPGSFAAAANAIKTKYPFPGLGEGCSDDGHLRDVETEWWGCGDDAGVDEMGTSG